MDIEYNFYLENRNLEFNISGSPSTEEVSSSIRDEAHQHFV